MSIRTIVLARLLVLVTLAGTQIAGPSAPVERGARTGPSSQQAPSPPDQPTVIGAGEGALEAIEAAIGRFDQAGLHLPTGLVIHVHRSDDACAGHNGLYGRDGDSLRIDLCDPHPAVIRHELAHAWERHKVDDATRRAFMDRLGLDTWNDHAISHPSRGVEQAAAIISWGLQDRPIQSINRRWFEDKLASYHLLTGRPSPRIRSTGKTNPPPRPQPRADLVLQLPSDHNPR